MDFVIIGAAVLFALIGLIRGGAKMFFGLFLLVIIMIASAFISALVCPLLLKSEKEDGTVEYTSLATPLMDPIGSALPSDLVGDVMDVKVVKGEDGALYLGDVKLDDALSEGIPLVGSAIGPFMAGEMHEGDTIRTVFAYKITEYIYETILWVILVIILAIVRNILRKKLYRFLDKHSTPSKIDRVVGIVLNLVIVMIIFWGVGALVAKFDDGSNWAHDLDSFFLDGVIAEPFMQNNPLLKLMDITLPIGGGTGA